MKKSAATFARTVLIDAGPLVAAIDAGDRHHAWAKSTLPKLSGRFVTCEAVIAETLHLLDNLPAAIGALEIFVRGMDVAPALEPHMDTVFAQLKTFAPEMDLADAWLVTLAKRNPNALVITTDTRGFSIFRVPFLSPAGLFASP